MQDASVSTRQASQLLGVHESSVKRWCNAGDISCWHTPGGHRRIPIQSIVSFAEREKEDAPILAFGESADRVWVGLDRAQSDEDFSVLANLAFEWIAQGDESMLSSLLEFLEDQGLELAHIFDFVIARALARVGKGYAARDLTIADEHRMTQVVRDVLIRLPARRPGSNGSLSENRRAVVGCGAKEYHELGAIMIRIILRRLGWQVTYLGPDVPTEQFHFQQEKNEAGLVCVSLSAERGPMGAYETAELLNDLQDDSSYKLVVGSSVIQDEADPADYPRLADVKFFNAVTPFADWVRQLDE